MVTTIMDKVGLVFTVIFTFICVKFIVNMVFRYLIAPAMNRVDYKEMGKWALVTGCTDGIGKEYAKALAARGCDIVLISRNMDKLEATSAEIEEEFGVETKIIQADFTDEGIYDRIARCIADIEIGTLINNVGVSYRYPEYFLDIPQWETTVTNLIRANIVSVTRMCAIVMPDMVKRGKGVVINIGSGSSTIPSPLLTVYSATKAFVDKFTEGLALEYSKKGIIIQCVLPGLVCSNMSGLTRESLLAPNAKSFVKSAMSLIGSTARTAGYLPHASFFFVLNAIYGMSNEFGGWLVIRAMETNRSKYLKKYKKQ